VLLFSDIKVPDYIGFMTPQCDELQIFWDELQIFIGYWRALSEYL